MFEEDIAQLERIIERFEENINDNFSRIFKTEVLEEIRNEEVRLRDIDYEAVGEEKQIRSRLEELRSII